MGLFDFLHRPSGKDTQETIKEIPKILSIYEEDGEKIDVSEIKEAQKIRHSDGTTSCLIKAKVIQINQEKVGDLDAAEPVCFEIPEGRYDLIEELIERYMGVKLNEKSYTYLGRAYSKDDIRLQPPTETVNSQIEKLNEELLEEVTNRRLDAAKRAERRGEKARIKGEAKKNKKVDEWQSIIQDRLNNPFIKGGIGKDKKEKYDGVDMNDGRILRIREVEKITKDTTGRYIYTARLSSTPQMGDTEILSDNGVPVVFTLPYRFNDIVNTDYDIQYKQKLIKTVLRLLSEGHANNYTKTGQFDVSVLHDIGGIDKDGNIIENTSEQVSPIIMSKIVQLQSEYLEKRAVMEKNTQREEKEYEGR